MYGTIARMKVKPGSMQQLMAMSDQMTEDNRLSASGHIATYIYASDNDPNELYMVVLFESKEKYHANAQSPAQNEQYMKLSQHFAAPPEWHDGEIVWSSDKRFK